MSKIFFICGEKDNLWSKFVLFFCFWGLYAEKKLYICRMICSE